MLPEVFETNLDELAKLAEETNIAIALAEAYNPKQLSFLGVHNELRNALFHVMGMFKVRNEEVKYNDEFGAAKSHFRRAGCDAYELLCMSCIEHITDLLFKYDHEDINIAIPGYYTEIRKTALDAKNKVAEMKQNKDLKKKSVEALFEYYFNQAELLVKYVKRINEYIPAIIEIQKQRGKDKRKERLISVGIAIVIAAVSFVLGNMF